MASDKLSQKISNINQHIESIWSRSISDPGSAVDLLSDALNELRTSLENLSAADEELCQRNSELAKAHEAAKKQDDFTSAIIDTMGALMMVLDRKGGIVQFNRTSESATGYSFDEVRGKEFWDIFPIPEEAKQIKAAFKKMRAGDFPNTYESHWVTKDGGIKIISLSNTALLDEKGSIEDIICTGIDIARRKRAEDEVLEKGGCASLSELEVRRLYHELAVHQVELEMQNQELIQVQSKLSISEEKYRDLYEYAPTSYFTLDESGIIQEVNITGARLLGTEREHLVGNKFQAYLAEGCIPKFNAFCHRVTGCRVLKLFRTRLTSIMLGLFISFSQPKQPVTYMKVHFQGHFPPESQFWSL